MNAPGSPSSALQIRYLIRTGRLDRHVPLDARGEARAAAAPEARGLDHIDRLLGAHGREDLLGRLVPAAGDIGIDVLGVHFAAVGKHDLDLFIMEGVVVVLHEPVGDRRAAHDMLVHDPLDHVRLDVLIRGLVAVDDHVHEHVARAEPPATDLMHRAVLFHGRLDPRGRKALFEGGITLTPPAAMPPVPIQTFIDDVFIHDMLRSEHLSEPHVTPEQGTCSHGQNGS